MSEKQKTLAKDAILKGKGLHTGLEVTMTIKPAEANFGFKFQRVDIAEKPIIEALAENVKDTSRGTTLEKDGVKISTIEHTLAALVGLGIDNALIEIDAPEAPILTGSSEPYINAIMQAGIAELDAERKFFTISEKMQYKDEAKGIEITAYPDSEFSVNVLVDYPSDLIRNQFAELNNMSEFVENIAACRTFVFFSELEPLLKNNLIKGGEIENAIVLIDKDIAQTEVDRVATLLNRPSVQAKMGDYLCNPDLKFNNEPARHKLLDVIGDLALAGMPLKCKIVAKRPGHMANTEFAKILRTAIKKSILPTTAPAYNPNKKPLYDINDIKRMLPHRPPFLLVDKIIEINEESIVGLKNVTMNEPFFVGHFPDEPVMPGVLMIEAMAQCGGIFALSKVPDPENYLTYFMKIDQVKFRDKVVPGDTLIFRLFLVSPIRRGIVHMRGIAFVGDKAVFEGELMAQLSKLK